MPPVYVSFYTDSYAQHAAGLTESLDAFRLPHDVRRVESLGSWAANCNRKPAFLLEMMRRHPDRALVWLDADARVKSRPVLFDELDCDFAAHWRHGAELLSGTLFFGPTPASRRLCEAWQRECIRYPDKWDQVNLQVTLAIGGRDPLRIIRLGPGYTRVFDDPKMGEACVLHLQASRTLRNQHVSPTSTDDEGRISAAR